MSKCYLTVLWGEDPKLAESEPQVYTFNSKAERDAFMQGVGEAEGWMGLGWELHEKPKTFDKTKFENWKE